MWAVKASVSIYYDQMEAIKAIQKHIDADSISSVIQSAIMDYLKKYKQVREVQECFLEHAERESYKRKKDKIRNEREKREG